MKQDFTELDTGILLAVVLRQLPEYIRQDLESRYIHTYLLDSALYEMIENHRFPKDFGEYVGFEPSRPHSLYLHPCLDRARMLGFIDYYGQSVRCVYSKMGKSMLLTCIERLEMTEKELSDLVQELGGKLRSYDKEFA